MNDQDFRLPHSASRRDYGGAMVLNPTSHPAYAPVKLNIKTGSDIKVSKSKVPEKPIAPYMRYSKKVWDAVKAQHPDAKLWEIGKMIGAMWKDLNENDKQEYILEYENSKAEYCEQIKAYHNSPQYQSFLSNAPRKRGRDDVKQGGGNSALMSSNIINTLNNNNRVAGISDTALSHYAIEPAEDDGFDDSMSLRQLALQRYNRNHRLLNEVFNEYVVPDNRSMITSQRMEQLKKQVASLESHQAKLKDELNNIEDKHEARRKKMIDAASSFNSELEKLNKFKVEDEQLKTFYTKHHEQIEKSWDEHCERAIKAGNTNNENNPAAFKMSLEHLVANNKALMTIPAPSCVSLVALQQIVETPVTPNVPAPPSAAVTPNPATQASTTTAAAPPPQAAAATQPSTASASSAQPAASQAVVNAAQPQQPAAQGPYPNHPGGNPPGAQQNMYSHQQQQQMMHHHQQQMMQQQHQHGAQNSHASQGPPHHGHTTPQPPAPPTAAASVAGAPTTPSGQSQAQPPHGTPPTIPPHGMPNAHPLPVQGAPNQAPHLPGQNIPPTAGSGEYQAYNQSGMPPNQNYPPNPAYMQQQPQQNPAAAMYPGQPPMYQQQHQYGIQQPYSMQRPPGPFMGPQGAPNAPNQPPGQPMMPMNRAPAPNGQPNQPYPYMMNQPQFNQHQQFRSTNTPPTNPSVNMASPVQPPSSSTPGATPAANPNAPQQPQINSTTPTPAIPNASQSPIVNRNPPAQQPGAPQVRQQQPGQVGPPNMNFYNGQMPMGQQPGQAHMYSMQQQQQHYQAHPNMMPQQQQPGQYPAGQPPAQAVPAGAAGQTNPQANSQYGGPTPQGQAAPPNMLYPNGPQHQGNMPYGHIPPNMTQQQVMMMQQQQQQHQMMNNQYGMYQGVPQQGQQPGMPPNVMGQQQPQQAQPQQPQMNNSSPSQAQSAASPAPQQPEAKAKDKKKKKKTKASSAAAAESS